MRSGRSDLFNIKKLQLRQFSQISFVSKILMFLDPTRYPVLDLKIAKAFAKSSFLPLQNVTFATSIPITERNVTAYDTWACWCHEIATVVNEALCLRAAASEPSMSKEPSSPWRTHRQRTRPACFWTARQAGRSIGDSTVRHTGLPVVVLQLWPTAIGLSFSFGQVREVEACPADQGPALHPRSARSSTSN